MGEKDRGFYTALTASKCISKNVTWAQKKKVIINWCAKLKINLSIYIQQQRKLPVSKKLSVTITVLRSQTTEIQK